MLTFSGKSRLYAPEYRAFSSMDVIFLLVMNEIVTYKLVYPDFRQFIPASLSYGTKSNSYHVLHSYAGGETHEYCNTLPWKRD
ncbi:hypothetical protein D3C76_1026480 [compost metagenome]